MRLRWIGWVAGLGVLLALAGCGSGSSRGGTSGGPAGTTANPALQYGFNVYTPNYVASLDHVLWWRSFPRTIAFTNDMTYNGVSAQAHFKSGFDAWISATHGVITYNWISNASVADITVTFAKVDPPANGAELGVTNDKYYKSTLELAGADITINLWDGMSARQFDDDLATATHEMGHALGISGHSPDPTDIMYPSFDLNSVVTISAHDLNTIESLYPQFFVTKARLAPPPPSTGPLVTVRMR